MNRTVPNYQDFTQQRKESIQRQLIQQEKISANHSSNKGLIFKNIHGTRTPEDNKTNDPIKEGAKGRNQRFKEGRRAANKYLKSARPHHHKRTPHKSTMGEPFITVRVVSLSLYIFYTHIYTLYTHRYTYI